jgi:hypothetical protein
MAPWMQQRQCGTGISKWLPFLLLYFSSCSTFVIATPSHNNISSLKVGLIYEESSPASLPAYFSSLISELNNDESLEPHFHLERVVLKWNDRDPPLTNIKAINEKLLKNNVSVVFSFLGTRNNEVFSFLMRNSYVPIVVVWSENSQWMDEIKVSQLVKMLSLIYWDISIFGIHVRMVMRYHSHFCNGLINLLASCFAKKQIYEINIGDQMNEYCIAIIVRSKTIKRPVLFS